ncbi:hypothetical protein JH06_0781 [Blastocystis sp. subtype 4]|uniref:hypothetical protein n=1 Tax=Blastocystis sp. subtype 4 TaxID=944170 RepID=UPI0007113084|nr:hypothetical protein JH06_0781 [Blastocystis sp. subtype 4]KNB46688.1 hypothetical protein JH06_0781 [Blastocystis sp. subtype 4]|eukprot:XP_014530120.1 hypothetical protein JH06_0781 [Blastocystis sp. subtype 4]
MVSVALFIPNIIGYIRAVTGILSFYFVDSNPTAFCWLYFISYILDALDGVCARRFNQCSHFGAVLDMICDRFCTASLYLSLSNVFPDYKYYYTLLLILEITSHWIQMYSAALVGKSHKALDSERPFILRFYYVVPYSLFFVCLLNETYIVSSYVLYYMDKGLISMTWRWMWKLINKYFFPVFVFKQIVSLVALVDSSKTIIELDERERKEKKN